MNETDIIKFIKEIDRRVEKLENSQTLRKITFPADGKIVIPVYAADPSGANSTDGQIYYNSTTKAFRKYTNSTWKNFETA